MSERCQTGSAVNFDNKKYIIFIGILNTVVAVLYFYRFLFATVAVSYVLGCLACYYGLNSSHLQDYVDKLKCHFVGESQECEKEAPVKGCETCGSKECLRHDPSVSAEPWTGLLVHKQLDQAIEDFYNTILEQFINSWYSKITVQPFFVDELRYQLRYASACLLQRAVKINYSRLITHRLVPCALRHLSGVRAPIHPAAANRAAELEYLKCVTNAIMPYVLQQQDLQNPVFVVLIREIFAGWVLLSLTDVLSEPHILNTLVVLATGNETMATLPTSPNYKVEFLETFARQTESIYTQRTKLFRLDLEQVISNQDYFYAFMQFLKSNSHINLLQFYNDITSFQTRILNPEIDSREEASIQKEARAIYRAYLSESPLPLPGPLADELRALLNDHITIKKLQTSRALYQAARQSHAVLEKIMIPKFLHSEEFYNLVIGSRIPTGFQKQMVKKPHERLLNSALRLGHRIKGALKPQTVDGQVLDNYEEGDNMDILKYLDNVALEESLRGEDLSTYKVVLTNVETKMQAPPRRGTVRVFSITVHRPSRGGAALWTVDRSEHDFHLLRAKLHEFHGDDLLMDLPLPSRRDNSPLETLRYKYEDFLQRLLLKSLLQTSELLRLFLTEDGDFSMVVQASTLNANTDITNIYQSVAHRLRKEKGQHLESFLRNLLVSSDIERYQALKQGRDVEEALEVSEDVQVELTRPRKARDIHSFVFGNNFGIEPVVVMNCERQEAVVGFTQCLMYLLLKVIKVRLFVAHIIGSVLSIVHQLADITCDAILNRTLRRVLSEQRLAHLIRLGHALLFTKKSLHSRNEVAQQFAARQQLLNKVPTTLSLIAGKGLVTAVGNAFDMIQKPHMNKQQSVEKLHRNLIVFYEEKHERKRQRAAVRDLAFVFSLPRNEFLVYNLLDLCIIELFPELGTASDLSKLPKS